MPHLANAGKRESNLLDIEDEGLIEQEVSWLKKGKDRVEGRQKRIRQRRYKLRLPPKDMVACNSNSGLPKKDCDEIQASKQSISPTCGELTESENPNYSEETDSFIRMERTWNMKTIRSFAATQTGSNVSISKERRSKGLGTIADNC